MNRFRGYPHGRNSARRRQLQEEVLSQIRQGKGLNQEQKTRHLQLCPNRARPEYDNAACPWCEGEIARLKDKPLARRHDEPNYLADHEESVATSTGE